MALKESGEMYLETILMLIKEKASVRAIHIADKMGFSKASVSRALGKLKDDKYILVDGDGFISLTEKGREVAGKIYERHILLTDFLVRLGVDEETAAIDACKIEHDISDETFKAIKNHVGRYSE